MKKNRIKTLAGDGVTIEMSPYDWRRLIFRHKDDERAGVSRSLVRRPFVRAVLVDFKRRKDHTHAHLHLAGDLGGASCRSSTDPGLPLGWSGPKLILLTSSHVWRSSGPAMAKAFNFGA